MITSGIETVTIEMAKDFLSKNTMNRRIDKRKVNEYLKQMRDGKWMIGESGIVIADDGTLLNGQTRLTAMLEYGKPLDFIVVRNAPKSSFAIMDTGKKRTSGDVLQIYGVPNSNNISATIKKEINLRERRTTLATSKGNGYRSASTNEEIFETYKRNESLYQDIYRESSNITSRAGRIMTESDIAGLAAYLIIDLGKPYDKVFEFFSNCVSFNNSSIAPCELLRRRLLADKASDRNKMPSMVKQRLIIKSWNYYVLGFQAKVLKYVAGEDEKIWFL